MANTDERIEKAIASLLKDGKHSNREIAEKYNLPKSTVDYIQDKHRIAKKTIVQESHVDAQKASVEVIKKEAITMQKRELNQMSANEIMQVFSRAEAQNQLQRDYTKIRNITMNALEYRFGQNCDQIGRLSRDDMMLIKVSEDVIGKYHDRMIGNGTPLIAEEVDEKQSFGVPLPTTEYHGTGEVIEVDV